MEYNLRRITRFHQACDIPSEEARLSTVVICFKLGRINLELPIAEW
jgi:hypothetical protein